MPDRTRVSSAIASAEAMTVARALDGGFLRIYAGIQPASVDQPIGSQVPLAELRFARPAAASVTAGVVTFVPLGSDLDANGAESATWFRTFAADGDTPVWDGSVGTAEATLILDSLAIERHAQVSIGALRFTVPR